MLINKLWLPWRRKWSFIQQRRDNYGLNQEIISFVHDYQYAFRIKKLQAEFLFSGCSPLRNRLHEITA